MEPEPPPRPPQATCAYAAVFNGITVGNNLNNTRVRSPTVSGTVTFAGNSLALNTNTEVRTKGTPPDTINFPGVGGHPGLVLNGGLLNNGDSTAGGSVCTIAGTMTIASQSYNSAQGANGAGGGLASNNRAFDLAAWVSGPGNMVIMNSGTNLPQIVSCPTLNTYSGVVDRAMRLASRNQRRFARNQLQRVGESELYRLFGRHAQRFFSGRSGPL